jgi:hypothetical protein
VIPGPAVIVPSVFEMLQKPHDAISGQAVDGQLCEPTRDIGRHEYQKEPQGITMRPHGCRPQASLERELVDEKRVEERPE